VRDDDALHGGELRQGADGEAAVDESVWGGGERGEARGEGSSFGLRVEERGRVRACWQRAGAARARACELLCGWIISANPASGSVIRFSRQV